MPRSARALVLLLGSQQAPDRACLETHHADAVADHVVQLARDPGPLVGDRRAGLLVALALELSGPRLQHVGLQAHDPDRCADEQRQHHADHGVGEVLRIAARRHEGDGVPAERDDGTCNDAARRRAEADRVDRHHRRERGYERAVRPGARVAGDDESPDRDRDGRDGRDASPGERQGRQDDGDQVRPERVAIAGDQLHAGGAEQQHGDRRVHDARAQPCGRHAATVTSVRLVDQRLEAYAPTPRGVSGRSP
jgi:hypothetical protein